jgi:uncharacterized protein YjbI with pentapeptide repeats
MKMSEQKLKEILKLHKMWLDGDPDGVCADLSDEDLTSANLSNSDLRNATLCRANLTNAFLSYANLSDADLRYANLSNVICNYANLADAVFLGANIIDSTFNGSNFIRCNLCCTNLHDTYFRNANFENANLMGANMHGAIMAGANLNNVIVNQETLFYNLSCPEKGSFVAYKSAKDYDGMCKHVIVELLVPEDAKRSSATTRKCRCDKAQVLSITSLDGKQHYDTARSIRDSSLLYNVGETVTVDNFDDDRWNECAPGIHFFLTRDEAVNYT